MQRARQSPLAAAEFASPSHADNEVNERPLVLAVACCHPAHRRIQQTSDSACLQELPPKASSYELSFSVFFRYPEA